MIKITSIFRQPIRQLILPANPLPTSKSMHNNRNFILSFSNMLAYQKECKQLQQIANDFWKQKYVQYLELEISRVLIDDKEYLYDKHDGIIGELR